MRVGGSWLGLDHADAHAECVVDRPHPLGVAAGQVVVDGDHVDGVAGERVEEDRERRGQCLALAGLHLGDRAVVQDHAADQLDVEVPLSDRPPGGLAAQRERLGKQVVERLAVSRALAKLVRLAADLGVLEQLHLRLVAVDRRHPALVFLELAPLAKAEGAIYESLGHGPLRVPTGRGPSGLCRAPGAGSSGETRRVSGRLRRFSLWRLTCRRMSSATSWMEWSISGDASLRAKRHPLQMERRLDDLAVGDAGFLLLLSSTSSTACSETCRPVRSKRFSTWRRTSSVTSVFLPLTSMRTLPPLVGCTYLMLRRSGLRPSRSAGSMRQRDGDHAARRAAKRPAQAARVAPVVITSSTSAARREPRDPRAPGRVGEPLRARRPTCRGALVRARQRASGRPARPGERDRDRLGGIEAAQARRPGAGGTGTMRRRPRARGTAARRSGRRAVGEADAGAELERPDELPGGAVLGRRDHVSSMPGTLRPTAAWPRSARAQRSQSRRGPRTPVPHTAHSGRRHQGEDVLEHAAILRRPDHRWRAEGNKRATRASAQPTRQIETVVSRL